VKADADTLVEVVLTGDAGAFRLPVGKHIVGRVESSAIPIRSTKISRQHSSIDVTAKGAVLQDMGSANGTFLEGVRISGAVSLKEGQIVSFADIEFKVSLKRVAKV
jgi:pSer/pThr/pTyr-binding forkhead associated (FHA) protein